jgi:ATP-dependent DNA helicase RecG
MPDWLRRLLPEGETRLVSGKVEWYSGRPQMVHPDHVVAPEDEDKLPTIEPIYPLTEGLTVRVLTKTIASALETVPEVMVMVGSAGQAGACPGGPPDG